MEISVEIPITKTLTIKSGTKFFHAEESSPSSYYIILFFPLHSIDECKIVWLDDKGRIKSTTYNISTVKSYFEDKTWIPIEEE